MDEIAKLAWASLAAILLCAAIILRVIWKAYFDD